VVQARSRGSPSLPQRDPRPDNRWQRGHVVDALYLADEGWAGLLAPSAARPEYLVLCLFRERDELVPGCVPLSPPERVHDPPAPPTGMTT